MFRISAGTRKETEKEEGKDMKFEGTVLVVTDIQKSRTLYEEMFDITVVQDFGENITFNVGLSLQEEKLWLDFLGKDESALRKQGNMAELYFETEAFDDFLDRLTLFPELERVHDVKEASWGQRNIRFYDYDKHIIEVGESMDQVMLSYYQSGASIDEVVRKCQYSKEYVETLLQREKIILTQ